MKKVLFILLSSIVIFSFFSCSNAGTLTLAEYSAISQEKDADGIVTVTCDVRLSNKTAEPIRCRMIAVYSGTFNKGLFLNDQAVACKQDSLEDEIFTFEPHTEYELTVYFKGESGGTETLFAAPDDIIFHILPAE
ncbi:MAG: hypothetical protein ACOYJB_02145 [Christensenellaceae bacterium]